MNPIAKKCAWWAAILIVGSAVILKFLPELLTQYFAYAWNESATYVIYSAVSLLISVVGNAAWVMGGALAAAAVMINLLHPVSQANGPDPENGLPDQTDRLPAQTTDLPDQQDDPEHA
jgi:hypothetical protein